MPDAAARWLSALRSVSYGPAANVGTPSVARWSGVVVADARDAGKKTRC